MPARKPNSSLGSSVDWDAVRARLAATQASVDLARERTPEEEQRILRARAKALSTEAAGASVPLATLDVAMFLVAHETYAIESRHIREVHPLRELTPLPGTPPFVLGVTNVRGQILSVIDIKRFFDLPDRGLSDLNKIVIVRNDALELGILTDAIVGMRSIPLPDIQPPLATFNGIRAEYLKGLTKERIAILEIDRLLSDPRIVVADAA